VRYARLYSKAGESPEVGALLEENPLSVALFFLSVARADLYGILPAEPRRYRTLVAPSAALPVADVEAALADQEAAGWIRRYEDSDGKPLLHIVNYHAMQCVRWRNGVGPPEHELPEWWEPPEELLELLQDLDLDSIRSKSRRARWAVLRERFCSTTGGRRKGRRRRRKAKAAPEQQLPEVEAPAADPAREDSPHQQAANACLAVWGLVHEDLTQSQKRSCYPAMSKLIELLEGGVEELLAWAEAQGAGSRELKHGANPARAIPAAVRRGVTAASWQRSWQESRPAPKELVLMLSDGTVSRERDWDAGSEYPQIVVREEARGNWDRRRGVSIEPVGGLVCGDGWFYSGPPDKPKRERRVF